MPAQSQQQQKLFGLALSVKRGETPRSEASKEVLDIVDSMSEKQIEDFAGTEHSGLPKKVESQLRGVVREIMRERVLSEAAGKEAMGIAAFTGTRGDAVQKFIDDNKLDAKKLFNYVKGGKLTDRLNFVTAIVGTPGNPVQKRMIKMFGESVNEDTKKRFEVDFYKNSITSGTSHEEIIRGDKFSDVISQATKVAKSKGMNYVEFYYKDAFIGSISNKNNYTFKKGRNSEKSPLPVTELKKLPSGNFSIKKGYTTFADYEKKAKVGDTILRYDKRGGMIKAFVNGSELHQNAEKYLDKVVGIGGDVVYLRKKGMKGVAQVPDYEKKDIGVLVLESKSVNEEKPGLWANIRAKQARGEKPAHGNSQAHKDAVKAGKEINKNESVNEASYTFGKETYTRKNLTPTQILDLAMGYVQTPITKLVGKTLGHRVNVANDLSNLTGTTQLDATKRGKSSALVLFLLKNSLVTKDEYVKLYKDLVEKHKHVIKYLKNASPEMRGAGGAARAAAKDMKGEFDTE